MVNPRRSEPDNLQRKHFAKINEKIQSKYEEMQKKLDKSKSIDSLISLNEDCVYMNKKHVSNLDLTESNGVFGEHKSLVKNSLTVEDIIKNDAILHDVNSLKSFSVSESECAGTIDNEMSITENLFFEDNFTKTSIESLNEVTKEIDDNIPQPSPPVKVSIRDKIGSRILAVKRKRRQEGRRPTKDRSKETLDDIEKMVLSNTTKQDIVRIAKKTKMATVTIALIEAMGIEYQTEEKLFCRFRLGMEKYKSKSAKNKDSVVKWHELINLNFYEENTLEISLWDKDTLLGRSVIDLLELVKEKTHKIRINLDGMLENATMFILLTISGTTLVNTVADLDDYEQTQRKIDTMKRKFAWYRLREDYSDVGYLSIIVYGAKGLSGSDCYCVVELGNGRLQTHTETKTCDPNWMKIFTFMLTDITTILEVTVYDERRNEEVGRISIPLLRIQNGKKIWYALKDATQRERAKGNKPRILLEMKVTWNLIKSSLRVVNLKEEKYIKEEQKFDRRVFARNISRAKSVLGWTLDSFKIVKTCFEWESKKWNVIALTAWLLICWYFKTWMLPLMLVIPFIWYRPQKYYMISWRRFFKRKTPIEDEDIRSEKEEKNTTLRQKINSLQEMVQTVQTAIGKFASLGERIKNLFNFTVPYLSCLAIFIILTITLIVFFIPVKYIFMCWGVHKFTRKILRPNRIPNNEILDLLSRVPDDETLLDCKELSLEVEDEEDNKIL